MIVIQHTKEKFNWPFTLFSIDMETIDNVFISNSIKSSGKSLLLNSPMK